jgi:hypothetical protein
MKNFSPGSFATPTPSFGRIGQSDIIVEAPGSFFRQASGANPARG